ncbi:MurR/RpiR family transcriptional regulator [Paenibacillus sp. FJAT-27812]|uniref:MurR/RpiR family transcriptional regulator n=1 Tax=Paenibacillus sp. FJAT-27812 TaxID=1684143 RepID=UPI0006A7B69A|nr:MurR/RpiR family transcriptional regulator [Paenibacillus sp. FJAT-27812]
MEEGNQAPYQDVFRLINKKIAYLNPALRRIAEYIIENPIQCKIITTKELAAACNVAESTITRFVKEIGLDSYRELKIGIAESLTMNDTSSIAAEEKYVYEDITQTDTMEMILEKVLYRNVQTMTETKQRINLEELGKAVEAIDKANVILFSSMGSSKAAAASGVLRFTRAGKKCMLLGDQSSLLMSAAIAGPEDVMIGISNSGRSKDVIDSMKLAQSRGARTIGITSFEDSPLTKYSDISLFTSAKSSNDGSALYWEAAASKTAQILVLDLIYASYAAKNSTQTLNYMEETYKVLRSSREK